MQDTILHDEASFSFVTFGFFFLNTEHVIYLYNLSIHAKPSQVQLLRSVGYLFVFLPRNMILSLFV